MVSTFMLLRDVITSPQFVSALALTSVFLPDIPALIIVGDAPQRIFEIVNISIGVTLLLATALHVFELKRFTAFTWIDVLGAICIAFEVEAVAGAIRDSSQVFTNDWGALGLVIVRSLGRMLRLITTGWQFVIIQHGSWDDITTLQSSEHVALKVFEVATMRSVLLAVAAILTIVGTTTTEYAWAVQNPSLEGDMDALDTLKVANVADSVLETVAESVFKKWEASATDSEDITLLELSIKGSALEFTYDSVHLKNAPKVVRGVNKVLYGVGGNPCVIGSAQFTCALLDVTVMRQKNALMNLITISVLAGITLAVMLWTHSSLREVIVKPVERMMSELGKSADSLLSFEKSELDDKVKKAVEAANAGPATELEVEMDHLKGLDLVDYTVAKLSHFVSRNLIEQADMGSLDYVKEAFAQKTAQQVMEASFHEASPVGYKREAPSPKVVGGFAGSMVVNGATNATERLIATAGTKQMTSNAGWDHAQLNESTWRPVSSLATIYVTPVKAGQGPQLGLQAMRDTWGWDILQLRNKEHVMQAVTKVFEAEDMLTEFNIAPETLACFLREVGGRYLPNPYHNLWHAGDVLYTTWRFIHDSKSILWLTKLEVLSALIAAYGHDAGHPAVSAGFLIAVRSEIALLHNDKSPLENMHCAILFDVLRNPDAAILQELTGDEWRKLRGIVIAAILGTDMLHHFKQNSDLQLFYEVNGTLAMPTTTSEAPACMTGDPGKRHFIIEMFVHAADISNSAKNFEIARNWAYLVVDEFFAQGEREKDLGLPVSPFMDKDLTNIATLQMNFIEFMVFPLFSSLIMLFPTLSPGCENLAKNVGTWGNKRIQELTSSSGDGVPEDDGAQPETGERDAESIQTEISKIETRSDALQQKLQTVLRRSQDYDQRG